MSLNCAIDSNQVPVKLEPMPQLHVPRVSVGISTDHRGNVLALAIDSVRRSTMRDWELVLMGNVGTDDTEEVVSPFDDAIVDDRRSQCHFSPSRFFQLRTSL